MRCLILLLIGSSILAAQAEPREWRNTTGEKSIRGTLVERDDDSIVIRRSDNRSEITIPLAKLHPEDRACLDTEKLDESTKAIVREEGVFDNLRFGDTRDQVAEKLKNSPIVEPVVDAVFLGRVGMNGSYRFKEEIGGIKPVLFFGWSDSGGLKEIFIQTEPVKLAERDEKLVPCWKVMAELFTQTHGVSLAPAEALEFDGLEDGMMKPTHFWKLEPEGSLQLGRAKDGDDYQIVARFSLDPVIFIPKSSEP